ncbi:MAG: F0F1 ATP synthase subunit A [Spirochaetia bacterium]|jgi:F-type H+-transporting ATPase subunit a
MTSLGAETIFNFAGFRAPNTLLATLLVDGVILLLVFAVRRRIALVPGRFLQVAESIVDYLKTTVDQVAGDRSAKIFPWVGVFFIYILINNLMGLFPGFGSVGFFRAGEDGGRHLVPILRAATSDLNTTLALAIVSVFATHVLAIRSTGLVDYLKRFFALNPIFLFVGILEIVQELTKFISFSFRLFGNISGGEIVLGTVASMFAFILPVPFLALEILVGVVQAAVFALLTMAFMAILTETSHH